VKNTRGVHYLAQLLTHAGQELLALELVTLRAGHGQTQLVHSGPPLDEPAKVAYRQRLRDLQEELAEAERHEDQGRIATLRQEYEFLAQELGRAVGLYQRDRTTGSPVERARVNVTRALKEVLDKIQTHHPSLGQHLTHTIKTGTFCSYMPDPRVPMIWTR
jgi:hypothetical protein